jgi:hypothetical protein
VELLLDSAVKGKLIDPVSILVVGEKIARLQFSIPVERFFGVAKRPDDLAANGLTRGCVVCNALRHVPLSVKQKVNNFPLQATINHLAKLRAVSIWIELAFLAPDWDGQSGATGLTPDNIPPNGFRGNGFHRTGEVHALGVGEILLREGGESESADKKWQDQRASQKSRMSPPYVGCLGRREFNSFDLLNPPGVATPPKSKPRRTQQSWLVSCFSARLGIRGGPLFDYFLDYNNGRFLLKLGGIPNRHHIFRIHPASYWTFRCITSWRPSNRSLDRAHTSYGHYNNDHYYNYERDNDCGDDGDEDGWAQRDDNNKQRHHLSR